jgi:hypothetical protein
VEDKQRYVAMRGAIAVDEDPVRGQETIHALAIRYDGEEAAERAVESDFRHQHRVTLDMRIDSVDVHGFES